MTTKIPVELSSTPGIVDGSNATAITIDSSENVGIGTTSPDGKLDVRGTIFVNGDGTGGRIFASSGNLSLSDGNGRQILRIDDPGSGNSHSHIFDSNGRLGVGTTSPDRKLHLNEAASSTSNFIHLTTADTGTTGSNGFLVGIGSDGAAELWNYEAQPISFATSSTERMRIDSSGNVGIGVTSIVREPLQVHRASTSDVQIHMTNSATGTTASDGMTIFANSTTSGFWQRESSNMLFATFGTERMRIDSSGTLIVDRTDKPNAGEKVAVSREGIAIAAGTDSGEYRLMYGNNSSNMILYFSNGSNQAQLSSAGAWVDASDVAYKKDIVDINYGLDTIKKLKPRTYKMKSDDEQQIGFVAQELELDIPEIVNGEDGSKGVAYGQLTAVLTKAIQEQQTQIEALQSEINTLKGGD